MTKETLTIENITLTLERKNIKNMYLRVLPPNGNVKVSAPSFISDEEIVNFIRLKKDWILKKQRYIKENNIKAPLKYDNGEKHYLWGKEYTLQLIKNDNVKHVLLDKEKSIIYLPFFDDIFNQSSADIFNSFQAKSYVMPLYRKA